MGFKYFIRSFIGSCLVLGSAQAQSVGLSVGSEDYHTMDRIEALRGSFDATLFLTQKSISHKDALSFALGEKTAAKSGDYSNVDYEYVNLLINNCGEWKSPNGNGFIPTKGKFGPFYKQKKDFLATSSQRFYMSLNPIIGYQALGEKANDTAKLEYKHSLQYGAKLETRFENWLSADFSYIGMEDQPIGVYDNYYQSMANVPGVSNYTLSQSTNTPNTYRSNTFRGNIHTSLYKDYINLSVGYDNHFIGDGYRSLLLSNFAGPSWYAKLRTKVWKFQYENIYSLYEAQTIHTDALAAPKEHKFATTHHLSLNVTPWLNVGVFESVVFGRSDRFEFGYLNPVIFYRAAERSMGSPDKIIIGLNAKAIVAKTAKVYGQFIINEFTAKEFFGNNGYWANKWGAQIGAHYFDAFTIPNLDLQIEGNWVRPFTYSSTLRASNNILTNYTHLNLPLAHQLGAGFREAIVKLKYRIGYNLILDVASVFYQIGQSENQENIGTNPLLNYGSKSKNYGFKMVYDIYRTIWTNNVNLSYRLFPNLYWDIGGNYRTEQSSLVNVKNTSWSLYSSVRLNLNRKDYTLF